jgi:hypothetical protein
MTVRCHHSRVRISFTVRKFGFLGAMLIATTAYMATPTPATAIPITYTFTPATGATATYGNLGTVTFTGTFIFDPATSVLSAVNITATGPVPPLSKSPETINSIQGNTPASFVAETSGATPAQSILFTFTDDLSNALDTLSSVQITTLINLPNPPVEASTSVTGAAVPANEPTTFALLGGALGLFFLRRRRTGAGGRAWIT